MGGLYVFATVLGRQSTALVSLGAACWAMTLWNPLTLWDLGFQLSGAATAGLILVGPPITDRVQKFGRALSDRFRRAAVPDISRPGSLNSSCPTQSGTSSATACS